MPLTPEEAALHLKDAETATRRSAQAYGYAKSSPHLILWGIIWMAGYLATDLTPLMAGWLWLVLIVAGSIGSSWLGWRSRPKIKTDETDHRSSLVVTLKMLGLMAAILAFITAVYTLFGPPTGIQMAAFPALLVGLVYVCIGLFGLGMRIAVTGAAIFVLTLGGYYLLPQYFLPWMAFVGGGALIAGGLWLRKI
jgi:hypothetical protein